METTVNEDGKTLMATANQVGMIAVFLNKYWYSARAQIMADTFPSWTYIRQSSKSIGQLFLNFFGLKLEEVEEQLNLIESQKYIGTLQVEMLDWIYIYELPSVQPTDDLTLYNDGRPIPILDTIEQFFYNDLDDGGIIDYDNRRFYSRFKYDKFSGLINNVNQRVSFESTPIPQLLWNAFDEFGLLVGLARLPMETNAQFKERILDVFRYPANSGDEGLTNGIARELGLVQRVTWANDSKHLYLKGRSIDPRSLRVDGQTLQPNEYKQDEFGNIIVLARGNGGSHVVSFIAGIEKYELHDQTNEQLYQLMFTPDGQATPLLRNWVAYIEKVAPIMWGRFTWDEGSWDTIDKAFTGLGYLPNMWDSDIEVWKNYTFDPKRWESESIWRS
ncbi:low copy number virion structural protein [Alicyclobacillus shizuokensis]|uniref:low copy number virion structural protein n=1 Tax=Alicyclobacillus shizuokensis TaxID=392014 RepID=UPI0012ED544A|nr:low copy number virion structural protein [Alicyclobacillus shizuokensis]